jgi:hypothetical protein
MQTPDSQFEKGVVYIATGENCRAEAVKSAKSLKAHNQSIPIAIFSDKESVDPVFNFHFLIENPEFSTLDKVKNLWKTPFAKTLFLDSDTYVEEDLMDIFDVLDRFDFVGTHEVARGYWYDEFQGQVPKAFCEFNGGVLLFRNRPEVVELLKEWHPMYLKTREWLSKYGTSKWMLTNDQPSLRYLLYHRPEIKLWILPTEYNAIRINGTYLWGKVKIAHGKGNIEDVAKRMNGLSNTERSFFQGFGIIADFSRIPMRHVFATVFRVNVCAFLNVVSRLSGKFKNRIM